MSWSRYAIACAILVTISVAIGFIPPRTRGETVLVVDWQYRWDGEWTPLTLPAHPPSSAHSILEMRTTLPARDSADLAMAFAAVIAPFEALIDGERVHQHPRDDGLATTAPPGTPWQLISVPADGKPHVLTLRIRAAGFGQVLRGTPMLGPRADLLATALERDAARLAAGLAAIVLGLFGLIVFARRGDARAAIGYAIATIGLGLYVVNYTHLKDVLIDAPRFWFTIWIIAVPLQSFGTLLFLDEMFGAGPKGAIHRTMSIYAAYCALLYLSHALGLVLYAQSDPALERVAVVMFTLAMNGVRVMILAASVVVLIVIGKKAIAGDDDARVYILGFLLCFALTVRDVAAALGAASLSWKSQMHIGVLGFAAAYAILLARRYARAQEMAAQLARQAAVQAKEKERLLRDLHDGVGSLTSNVRLLAELGRKSGADASKTLSTIADLSSAALAELRSFVQALDDTTMTWDALFAELRRFGATLFEGAGATFTMTTKLDVDGAPPGLLTLNLVRIFREVLTNALKQEGVKEVVVDVDVTRARLTLRISNDGADSARREGVDTGRGIKNLKARAAELGGSLDVDLSQARAQVSLLVPLPIKPPDPEPREVVGSQT